MKTKKEVIQILLTYATWNRRFKELNETLKNQTEIIDETRYNLSSALQNAGIPSGNNTGDPTFNSAVEIIKKLNGVMKLTEKQIEEMQKEKEKIENALKQLSFHEKQVIEMYYFQNLGRTFKIRCARIGDKIGYSPPTIERIYSKAIKKLQEIL